MKNNKVMIPFVLLTAFLLVALRPVPSEKIGYSNQAGIVLPTDVSDESDAEDIDTEKQSAKINQLDDGVLETKSAVHVSLNQDLTQASDLSPDDQSISIAGLNTAMSQGFEGVFPTGLWTVSDDDGSTNGEYYWGVTSFKPHSGSKSAWVATGGANGVDASNNYPNNLESWMVYGPIDLSIATGGNLQMYYWNRSELDYDYLAWGASTDGINFYGWGVSGDSQGWKADGLDLTNVPGLGSAIGYNSVWIGFWFESDGSINDKGAFVDDIVLKINSPVPGDFYKSAPAYGATNLSANTTLQWGASTGATSYEYCYGTATPCSSWTSNGSATSVTLSGLLANTTYYWNVRAINSYGTTYSNESTPEWPFFTASIGIPVISSLTPVSVLVGGGEFSLVVNGTGFTNFAPGNTVYWNGAPRATTYVSSTKLSAVIPAADITSIGIANVTVKNQNSVESNAIQFGIHTFADALPSAWYWRWVEGFYDKGITTGCSANPAKYCPDRQVTRAEMAVFILRAKNGTTTPVPATTDLFADVPVTGKEWMKPWIEQFFNEGITTGCSTAPLKYCPERQVTRAEMAVFVLRAIHGKDYVPPAATGIFSDVPVAGKAWMQPWIEQFYNEGITTGCASSPLRYCPEQSVTRAEMAVFIDRAFGYPQLP